MTDDTKPPQEPKRSTQEFATPPLQALTKPDDTQDQPPPDALDMPELTHEEWRMLIKFKAETEQRLSKLLSIDEIQSLINEILHAVLRDRPTTEQVAEMIEAVRTAEMLKVEFITNAAVQSIKDQSDSMIKQNNATADRLTRENTRMVQTMQETFARAMEESRRINKEVVEDAKALVHQHAGSIAFLQTIVGDFNKRTDAINDRLDDEIERRAQLTIQLNDAEKRFTEWVMPFQGETGFIALVKKQSKVIDSQQQRIELQKKFLNFVWEQMKSPQFWLKFGGLQALLATAAKAFGFF